MPILLRLLRLAWRHPRHLLLAYFCLFCTNMFGLAIPHLLGTAIDEVLGSGSISAIIGLTGTILGVSILRGISAYGQTYLGEWVSQLVAYDLRNSLYAQLMSLSFGFHDTQQTGNLMSKATADVEAVRNFIQTGTLRFTQVIVLVGGTAIILSTMNWRLALVGLAFVPIVVWRSTLVSLALRKLWLHIQERLGYLTTLLQENLSGARVVRSFGAQEYEQTKFRTVARQIFGSTIDANRNEALNTSMLVLAFSITTAVILWFGGQEIMGGRLSPGQLASFVFYLGLITGPVRQSGQMINRFSRAASAGQRVFDILDAESPIYEKNDAITIPKIQGHVEFKHVVFSYTKSVSVLKDISFQVQRGQVVAILGGPGSGKTSLVHLIPRFYDVGSGQVKVDGVDVRDITLDSLRRQVGIVMQDVFLFSNTIFENIAYGMPKASIDAVQHAAKIAQFHQFVASLPEGYQTLIGERGITLSGGQRQRLAIARTILLNPPILILDDSSSSVDAATEERLLADLRRLMKGRTTVIIAHRINSIRNADLILVLDQGEIVQQGTHSSLMLREGPYRDTFNLQMSASTTN